MTVASPPVVTQPVAATLVSEAMPFPSSPGPLFRVPAAVGTGQPAAPALPVFRARRGWESSPVVFPPGATAQRARAPKARVAGRAAAVATGALALATSRTR